MSSPRLCGGLYQSEKRRSSFALAQISKEKDKQKQEEDDELAHIAECDAVTHFEQKIPVNNVAPRRISFDFERLHDSTQSIQDSQRRQSLESESSPQATDGLRPPRAMTEDDVPVQEAHQLLSLWLRFVMRFEHLSVDPEGVIAFYWKAAVTLAVIYNCILIISRMAFDELRVGFFFSVLDTVCDAIYVLDLVIEARTSFLSDGLEVVDSAKTTEHYKQKSYFQLDLLAICPTQTLVLIISGFVWISPFFGYTLFEIWSYVLFWPGIRMNRLLKYHTMENFFQRTESRTNKPNLLRAFKLGTHLGLVIHWFGCLYYMLSEYEGLGSNEWVYPMESTSTNFSKKYITCMFWSVMTLTTIGERPPPQTEVEYIFTGLTFLIGVFVFAAVVGNVGDVISNMNAARRDFQARMDQIKFYMDHRNVPDHLQNRVKRWAEYTWDRTNCIDEPSVLQLLPDRLRTEVAIHVHLDILKKVSIFQDCEEGLLRELVLKLRPQIFSPGDYICRIGEIGRNMYIINHGKVEILFPDVDTGIMKQVSIMHPGSFFGEISLLKLDEGQNRRTADVRSLGFSELFCLSRRDLIVALSEYPEAKKILEDYGRERYNNTKRTAQCETDDSRPPSPRSALNDRKDGSKKPNARSVFERVMKQEGFTKLFEKATKSTEISEIKAAINEMRAEKKSVRELENALRDKTAALLAAQAQIASLERMVTAIAHAQGANSQGRNMDNAERQERSNLGGLNLTPRWPDLVPRSSQQNENGNGDRSLHKTSLHARGCLKEVPTSYTERLSKQNMLLKYRGKPFGPLFVGSRRRCWTDSLNIKSTANASLSRRESSPTLCNPNSNAIKSRQTTHECHLQTQSRDADQMQPNTRFDKVHMGRSQNTNVQDIITSDQTLGTSKTEVLAEQMICGENHVSSFGTKVNVHLQAKVSSNQNTTTRSSAHCTSKKHHQFYTIANQAFNTQALPSKETGCVGLSGGYERLQTEICPQHDTVKTSGFIREPQKRVEGEVAYFRGESETNTCPARRQRRPKVKISPPMDSELKPEPAISLTVLTSKNSISVPSLTSSPRLSKSNQTFEGSNKSKEPVFLSNSQSDPQASNDGNFKSSVPTSNELSSGKDSIVDNSLEAPIIKEQRRPSISLSLFLDDLSSLDFSNSENEDYESDDDDVSDD